MTDAVAAGPATWRRWTSPAAICTAAGPVWPAFADPLPPDLGRSVTDAVAIGFTAGIADTLLVTGGIVLAALVAVRLLRPGRR